LYLEDQPGSDVGSISDSTRKPKGGGRVLLMHWGHRGAGPKLTYEMGKAWDAEFPGEIARSFHARGEHPGRIAELGLAMFPVTTSRRTRPGIVLGLPRLAVTAFRLRRFIREQPIDSVICVMSSIYQRYIETLRSVSAEEMIIPWGIGTPQTYIQKNF
jgi:hypothetical protein